MGDRAYASLTLYQAGPPKEVEAICAFIEEWLCYDVGGRMTELEAWGDYDASEVSMGLCDEAEGLAEKTPGSIWVVHQDGYSGPGEAIYHLPGLGVWRCTSDAEPLFSRTDVQEILKAPSAERDRLLGTPWVETCEGLAKWLTALPEKDRPRYPRPTVDEVESWEDKPELIRAIEVEETMTIRQKGSTDVFREVAKITETRGARTFHFAGRMPWTVDTDEEVEYVS